MFQFVLIRDPPPIMPTDTNQGYKQMKAKIGQSRVRPWKWMPFTNPARKVSTFSDSAEMKTFLDRSSGYGCAIFQRLIADLLSFKDGAIFHHWRRVADEGKDYPFARFNKVRVHICYGYGFIVCNCVV